jgi:hypothetical protein
VGSSKVDLWSAARNEDNRFIGAGDNLGMILNKSLAWTHLIHTIFLFQKFTCIVKKTFGKLLEYHLQK